MLGTAALLVLLGAALLTFLLTATTVTLRTSTAAPTNDRTPTLRYSLTYPGDVRADDVTVRVDGDEHSPRLVRVGGASEQIAITLAPLTDGTHRVEVAVAGAGILPRTQTSVTSLTIDTVAPALRIVTAPNGDADDPYVPQDAILFTKRPAQISVAREQGSELQVSSSIGDVSKRVGGIDAPRERISVPLADGAQVVRLTAIDSAGNSTSRSRSVVVDTKGPSLPRRLPRRVTNAQLALALPAQDPHGVKMTASLNGVELEDVITAPAPVSAIAAGAQELPSPTNGTWKIATEEPVLEGRHRR
jgi:hypothetical protein